MTNDLGVWTADDCALVLIDYQNEMPPGLRPNPADGDLREVDGRVVEIVRRADLVRAFASSGESEPTRQPRARVGRIAGSQADVPPAARVAGARRSAGSPSSRTSPSAP
jgi:nicotinamidase-related amidase